MPLKILLLGLILAQCTSYQSRDENENKAEYVVDDSDFEIPERRKYSDYFDSVQYIPLETTENALLSSIGKVVFMNDNFVIQDNHEGLLYIFNNKGDFIRKIGNKGKGPGEYRFINNFILSEKEKQIFTLDRSIKMINIYDSNGKFLNDVKLDFEERIGDSFIRLDNGNFLFPISTNNPDHNFSYIEVTKNGKVIERYLKDANIPYGNSTRQGSQEINDLGYGIKLVPRYLDKILEYKEGRISTYIEIISSSGYDKQGIANFYNTRYGTGNPMNITKNNTSGYKGIWGLGEYFETGRLISFSYLYTQNGVPMVILIDKKSGTIKRSHWDEDLDSGFTYQKFTSIQLPYFIKYGPVSMGFNGDQSLGDYFEEFKQHIITQPQFENLDQKIKSRVQSLNSESNPVLIIYKLKEQYQ